MQKCMVSAAALLLCTALLFAGVSAYLSATMPAYRDSLGDLNHTEKITGLYLVRESATQGDNLIIYGSSELRTHEISTHPANFFAGKRAGFQVNLVGRGSCQSIIHALSIGASGDALTGQKVVLITSPQSYVAEGIAPDLFMANFSEQQYFELLADDTISQDVKQYLSARVLELFSRYEASTGEATDPAIRYVAEHYAEPTPLTALRGTALRPYYALRRYTLDLGDRAAARRLLNTAGESVAPPLSREIDWAVEEADAVAEAQRLTDNNDFGMLNDYYTTYIGSRLARQAGQDRDLSYTVSQEYDDLRVLFEICRQKGIKPLFIHVPLHGSWSDYTGFTAERRSVYYDNVRAIVDAYGIAMLDLTGYEYDDYVLCDVMHLGWKGWLYVDRALIDYYDDL